MNPIKVILTLDDWEGYHQYLIEDLKLRLDSKGELLQNVSIYSYFKLIVKGLEGKPLDYESVKQFLLVKRADGLTNHSLNTYIIKIKSIDKYLDFTREGYSKQFEHFRQYPKIKTHKTILTYPQMKLIANTFGKNSDCPFINYRWQLLVWVLVLTGCRINEVCHLKTEDVYEASIVFRETKFQKEREVALDEKCCAALKEIATGKYVFARQSTRGEIPLSKSMAYMTIKKKADAAKIPIHVHPHLFRHSFISNLVNDDANLVDMRDIVGHENIASTNVYLHTTVNKQRATLAKTHPYYQSQQNPTNTIKMLKESFSKLLDLQNIYCEWHEIGDKLSLEVDFSKTKQGEVKI